MLCPHGLCGRIGLAIAIFVVALGGDARSQCTITLSQTGFEEVGARARWTFEVANPDTVARDVTLSLESNGVDPLLAAGFEGPTAFTLAAGESDTTTVVYLRTGCATGFTAALVTATQVDSACVVQQSIDYTEFDDFIFTVAPDTVRLVGGIVDSFTVSTVGCDFSSPDITLTLDDVGAPFTVVPTALTVPDGTTQAVTVRFDDLTPGARDTLRIDLAGDGTFDGPARVVVIGDNVPRGWFVAKTGNDTTGTGAPEAPYLTIGRAIESARAIGDSVLIAPGTYDGPGNAGLVWGERNLVIASTSGDPTDTVIDAGGQRAFSVVDTIPGPGESLRVEGVTIQNASTAIRVRATNLYTDPEIIVGAPFDLRVSNCRLVTGQRGIDMIYGALRLEDTRVRGFTDRGVQALVVLEMEVRRSVFRDNGLALDFDQTDPVLTAIEIEESDFVGNDAGISFYKEFPRIELVDCRVDSSRVDYGLSGSGDSQFIYLERCSVVGNVGAGIVTDSGTRVELVDTDVVGNGAHGISGAQDVWISGGSVRGNQGWGVAAEAAPRIINAAIAGPAERRAQFIDLTADLRLDGTAVLGNASGGISAVADLDSMRVVDTVIADNGGAGLELSTSLGSASLAISTTTIADNTGPGLVVGSTDVEIDRSIIALNDGVAVDLGLGGTATFTCSDLFGNVGGNWIGDLATQLATAGNFEADPLFVDAPNGDYTLVDLSPAAEGNHPDGDSCGRIGAFDPGAFVHPQWISLADVGNDQGRQLRLIWEASHYDDPEAPQRVEGYVVYRRQDQFATLPDAFRSGGAMRLAGWDFLNQVPARGDAQYQIVATTLCDSTDAGPCPSAFFVSAITDDSFVFFDSVVDSGMSIDNLSPSAPLSFAIAYDANDGYALNWAPSAATDLREYRVYRREATDPPGEFALAHSTISTNWGDGTTDLGVEHRVAAVDFAGNESELIEPGIVTAADGIAGASRTRWIGASPNPFNPATVLRFELAASAEVEVRVFDASGRIVRSLDLGELGAGPRAIRWNGRDQRGATVASGVYFVRVVAGDETFGGKISLLK